MNYKLIEIVVFGKIRGWTSL